MTQVTQIDTGKMGNTKSSSRSRKWVFTLNNYTEVEYETLKLELSSKCEKYIIGKEGDTKTPHLQCYAHWKNSRSFSSVKRINDRLHVEKAKGSEKDNFNYCSKEGNYVSNFDCIPLREKARLLCLKQEYSDVKWRGFQDKILQLIEGKPDKRKIFWYWEKEGNMGKSYLCKWIALKKNIIMGTGKTGDIFNQLNEALDTNSFIPTIIVVDNPRAEYAHVNYGALEQLKNGFVYSGKYKGGQCLIPIPHVIVFANDPPDESQMSADRWEIEEIVSRG